ncbi:MAG: hypothetical protein PHT19_09010 [Methylococcus sp.]|nr:hypothetical protein [Methylococcus sp.]
MRKMAKTFAFMLVLIGMAGEASAALVVLYTGPMKEKTLDGVIQRLSCDVLNLDKKVQSVTADVVWLDGSVLATNTADVQPGQVTYNFVTWAGATGNLYCRFTVKTKKVRGYITLYNQDGLLISTQEAY